MKIVIPGNPIPKKRARHARHGNRIVTYDEQEIIKNIVKCQMKQVFSEMINHDDKKIAIEASNLASSDLFEVNFRFYLPLNKNGSEGQKNAKLWGFQFCNKKPDCSNMIKFYEDCANNVLYHDDSQIVKGTFEKKYSSNPRTEIEIKAIKKMNINSYSQKLCMQMSPDELKALLADMRELSLIHPNDVDTFIISNDEIFKTEWLENTSSLLVDFTNKHIKLLNKISKVKKSEDFSNLNKNNKISKTSSYKVGKAIC